MKKIIKITLISLGIVFLLIALILLVLSTLQYNGDEESLNQTCTLISCSDLVTFKFPQEAIESLEFSTILVEFEDETSSELEVLDLELGITFSVGLIEEFNEVLPTSKERVLLMQRLRVTNLETQEVLGFEIREIQESFSRPNGPNCEPTCSNLVVLLELSDN
ncbi:MAG: hypothetical protein ACMXYB_03530 [Candidatus Woesearchaeota archaeon]